MYSKFWLLDRHNLLFVKIQVLKNIKKTRYYVFEYWILPEIRISFHSWIITSTWYKSENFGKYFIHIYEISKLLIVTNNIPNF